MKYSEKEYDNFVKHLEDSYPSLFGQPYGGIAVGPGWWPLIEHLCSLIHNHVDHAKKAREGAINFNQMLEDCKHGDYRLFNEQYEKFSKTFIERRMEEILTEQPRKVPDEVKTVKIAQVKEKFGTLRFYVDGADEFVHGAIWLAESLSGTICEECGKPGTQRSGGWVRTLCDEHEEAYQEQMRSREMKSSGLEE